MIVNSVSVILLISQLVLVHCLSLVSSVHDLRGQLQINNNFLSPNGNANDNSSADSSHNSHNSNNSAIYNLFSPSRSYLKLIEYPSPSTSTYTIQPLVKYYHFDKDGLFEIPNLQNGKQYELIIESMDFKFKRSNHFKIVVGDPAGAAADPAGDAPAAASGLAVYELLKGHDNARDGGKRLLKLKADPFVINQDAVMLRSYSAAHKSQLDSLPFVGYVKSHPYMAGIVLACVVLGLLPQIISKIDPSFAERVLESAAAEDGQAAKPAVQPAVKPSPAAKPSPAPFPAAASSSSSGRYKNSSSKRRR